MLNLVTSTVIVRTFQSEQQRKQVLMLILDHEPIAENVDISKLGKMTEGFSGSDLQELCRNASVYRVRDYLRTHTQLISNFD